MSCWEDTDDRGGQARLGGRSGSQGLSGEVNDCMHIAAYRKRRQSSKQATLLSACNCNVMSAFRDGRSGADLETYECPVVQYAGIRVGWADFRGHGT